MISLTECCRDTQLRWQCAATAGASLMIKSTMLNRDQGAAFILGTYDCLYFNVLSGVTIICKICLNMLTVGTLLCDKI